MIKRENFELLLGTFPMGSHLAFMDEGWKFFFFSSNHVTTLQYKEVGFSSYHVTVTQDKKLVS